MFNYFRPRPGRFGTQLVLLTSGRVNTGTLAAGTQTHTIGGLPRKAIISGITVSAETWPTAATSCTVTLVKRDASAAADVTLSSAVDVNDQTDGTAIIGALLTTLTDKERLLDTNDTLKVSLVTTGSVTVQPDDIVITVELMVLN